MTILVFGRTEPNATMACKVLLATNASLVIIIILVTVGTAVELVSMLPVAAKGSIAKFVTSSKIFDD